MSGMILFLLSFLSISGLLLPQGLELLAVLLTAVFFVLSKAKVPVSSLNNIEKKPLIRSISLSGILILYFIINCYGRYSDINMMIPMAIGLVLLVLSLPMTLKVASMEKALSGPPIVRSMIKCFSTTSAPKATAAIGTV